MSTNRMNPISAFFKAAIEAWVMALLRVSAEASNDIDRIEAAAHDDWRRDMESVTSTAAERQQLRDSTILIAQLGIRGDEIMEMANIYHIASGYGVTVQDIRDLGAIKGRARR